MPHKVWTGPVWLHRSPLRELRCMAQNGRGGCCPSAVSARGLEVYGVGREPRLSGRDPVGWLSVTWPGGVLVVGLGCLEALRLRLPNCFLEVGAAVEGVFAGAGEHVVEVVAG